VKLGKRMTFEKKEIREKNLKEPPGWILGIIKRELNLFDLCHNEMVLCYPLFVIFVCVCFFPHDVLL
jgi:hypothetical protein